jgi:hypothetical protein
MCKHGRDRNITAFTTQAHTSMASAYCISMAAMHSTFRTRMVVDNGVLFHNDGPVKELCDYCTAFHF